MERHNSSAGWHITYHFIWGPARAKACLCGPVAIRLEAVVDEVARELEFTPVALVIHPDRVYLAAVAPPTLAPHSLISQVKAQSARVLRDEFPELTRIPSLWTRVYHVMAGEHVEPDDIFRCFEDHLPPRRPRGRPRRITPDDSD